MSKADFLEFCQGFCRNLVGFCNGAIYICMSSSELPNLKTAFEDAGGHWQSFIIWAKNTFTLSRSDWQNQYEPILYGWSKDVVNHYFAGFRNQGNIWKKEPTDAELLKWAKGMIQKTPTDVWEEKKPSKSPEHPTMKPIKLVAKAIQASSLEEGTVLDLFGGSGSTLIACEQTNRKCYIMELDPRYCQVIIERWAKFTGKDPIREDGVA